ncbi:MAG: L,D-transpeptidase [Legionella sp.]|nr:L,D-transpeptidase [Legionella sp.]
MEKHSPVLLSFARFLLVSLFVIPFSSVYSAGNTFIFNPNTLSWKAINENGKVVRTGKGSGGQKYCSDIRRGCKTPSGVYHIISKGGPGCRSSRYPVGRGGAPMPYCMYFNKNYAVHGSYEVPNYNASHGCVRLIPSDARWLSNNFMKIGTKVVIKPY